MASASSRSNSDRGEGMPERPEFAVTLGLLPPYTMDDVKRAYLDRVKLAHPDRGGERLDFERIQAAFEQAQEYLRFRTDRRQWIAARMEDYLAVGALVEELERIGAEVETTTLDWVRRSFGDFASMTETIVGIRLTNSPRAPEAIDAIVREHTNLQALKRLELGGSAVRDSHVWQLRVFRQLAHLDLSKTQITSRALAIVEWLPSITSLDVAGTSIGWWQRWRLRRTLRKRSEAVPGAVVHPTNLR